MPQHLSGVASQRGYSSVDLVTLEDMVLEVSQRYFISFQTTYVFILDN